MTSLASLKMEGGAGGDQTSYQKSLNIQKWFQRKKKKVKKRKARRE